RGCCAPARRAGGCRGDDDCRAAARSGPAATAEWVLAALPRTLPHRPYLRLRQVRPPHRRLRTDPQQPMPPSPPPAFLRVPPPVRYPRSPAARVRPMPLLQRSPETNPARPNARLLRSPGLRSRPLPPPRLPPWLVRFQRRQWRGPAPPPEKRAARPRHALFPQQRPKTDLLRPAGRFL